MTSAAPTPLELRAGDLRLQLRPDLGGCIAGLWLGELPVLRSVDGAALTNVRDSASYPLLPYSNRLGYRRFHWLGKEHTVQPNFPDTPHALHGLGWQRAWEVAAASDSEAELVLRHAPDADWPFAFEARQRFMLSPGELRLELLLRNDAPHPAPVGLGWHPYFPKRERSRLHAELKERWEADPTKLPTRRVAQPGIDADVAHLDFDHCFEGWVGAARIRDEKLALKLTSSLDRLVVYTPPHERHFAVEPVSHVNNAINMAEPAQHGLRTLGPDESTGAWMQLAVARV
jgi:aldose 1-epimerase